MLTYWVAGGLILMLLEFVIPGGVVAFLGLGALAVAGLIYFGQIDHWITAFTAWFITSLLFLLVLRGFFQKLLPGEEELGSTDEDADAAGHLVEVVETISKGQQGRVSYLDSTWPATCHEQTLRAGTKARLVSRENVVWVVEPLTGNHGQSD